MIIKGVIQYNNNGKLTDKEVYIDTTIINAQIDLDVCDAVAFALYGKTVYKDIVREDIGVPFIVLDVSSGDKNVHVVRQPEYDRVTHFGTKYLAKELFALKTEKEEYDSLSSEHYYALISDYVDVSFEEFINTIK